MTTRSSRKEPKRNLLVGPWCQVGFYSPFAFCPKFAGIQSHLCKFLFASGTDFFKGEACNVMISIAYDYF
jgi:hypothetical protein